MNVLGLHGVYPRSHDSNACLVIGSDIVALVEEERFTRIKRAFDKKPHNAIAFCMENAGIKLGDIDAITWGWQGEGVGYTDILPEAFHVKSGTKPELIKTKHHRAHAASVFYTSPYEQSAILVIDGQGEDESSTIWEGSKDGLKKLDSYPVHKSLGYMYSSVSRFCGLGTFGSGKLMGLAPYGEAKHVEQLDWIFDSVKLPVQEGHDLQDAYLQAFSQKLIELGFTPARFLSQFNATSQTTRKISDIQPEHRDLAASAQKFLELKVLELVREAKKLTGLSNLCLAGGVAMNCVANSLVQDSGIFTNTYMQPGCEDSGIGLGAALAVVDKKVTLRSPYLGPSFSSDHIAEILNRYGLSGMRHDDVSAVTAELLAKGKVVGWFQGGLEYGPRALGGRSILASPETRIMNAVVNDLKSRESWRPFGPSVLAESGPQIFRSYHSSPYMLRSFQVEDMWLDRIPAVVHIDGSTRPQTVEGHSNPRFHSLIKAFAKLTGTPAVLNTSFNKFDEPIVATPVDAIKTFYTTGLDALVLEDIIIEKGRE